MSIKVLDNTTIEKLKSDVTIPDLKQIVKELLENCLDAKASKIEILVKNNGIKSLTIEDDGVGIPLEDRPNMCLRYHTSKLEKLEDGIEFLGFRGEALSSICRDCGQVEGKILHI